MLMSLNSHVSTNPGRLCLCPVSTFFSFLGQYYQQTFGTVMGSPLLVTVANLVMDTVDSLTLYLGHPQQD